MKVRDRLLACLRGLALVFITLAGSITLFVLTVLSLALMLLGLGVFTTPMMIGVVRRHANQRRLLAAQWSGVQIRLPYRPLPADRRSGLTGQVELCTHL